MRAYMLSAAIALHVEPGPTWDQPGNGSEQRIVSRGKMWTCPERCIDGTITPAVPDYCNRQQPRDMTSDPEMTVFLIQSLIREFDFEQFAQMIRETDVAINGTAEAFQEAVAEAYARAHGLNVPE